MPDGYEVDPKWLRTCADDCDGAATSIQQQLGLSDQAEDNLRNAAHDWKFLDSIDDMSDRWEKLNKLLRKELADAAEEFRFSASNYEGHENWFEQKFHGIRNGWDSVLNYD